MVKRLFSTALLSVVAVLAFAAGPALAHDGAIGYGTTQNGSGDNCTVNSACTYLATGPANTAAPAGGVLQSFTFTHDAMPAGTAQLLVFDTTLGANPVLVASSSTYAVAAAAAGTTTVTLPGADQPHIDGGQIIGMTFTPTTSGTAAPGLTVTSSSADDVAVTCEGNPQMNQAWSPLCIGSNSHTISLSAYFYSDIRPPVVTAGTIGADNISPRSATFHSDVNPNGAPATAYFKYGTSMAALGSKTSSASAGNGSSAADFAQSVTGLSPSTTYYFAAVATNEPYGGTTTGPVQQFTTAAQPVPDVTGATPSDPTEDGITLSGTVNPHSADTGWAFEYSTDTSFGSATPEQVIGSASGENAVPVSARINGLEPNTTYHWRLVATNDGGGNQTSTGTFSTKPGNAPALAAFEAQNLTASSAHLHFTLDPEGYASTFHIEFGTTTAYGSSSSESGQSPAARGAQGAYQDLSSLGAGTTYHWRVVATNRWGTTVGPDQTFTTPAPPVVTADAVAHELDAHTALIQGTVDPRGIATSEYFEYGTTTAYGDRSADAAVPLNGNPVLVQFRPNDLVAGTLYHWRIVAVNAGGTTVSEDHVFVTLPEYLAPVDWTLDVQVFDHYVTVIYKPEAAAVATGTTFTQTLGREMRDGRLTVGEQRALTALIVKYQRALATAIKTLAKATPSRDLAAAHKAELARLKAVAKAVAKLKGSVRKPGAKSFRSAYLRMLQANRKKPALPKAVDKKAADVKGKGVFNKKTKSVSLSSPAAKALVGTWYGQQDGSRITLTADGKYSSPNGGGGTWKPTSDGVQFTGTQKYNGGHATVKNGVMEFYWRNKDGSINYFVYLKG